MATVGLVVAVGLCALVAFHYAFSEDWLGPLRPGSGAWGEDALDIAIWKISLSGHWLHVGRGILNTSPIYFFALFGLLILGRLRDRRVVIAAALYAATAGINGLHTLWVFGHDLPSRFIMTALPVLVMGLAWGLPPLLRRATTSFLVTLALAISLESVVHTLTLPEAGFKGNNLLGRAINRFYPTHLHYFGPEQKDLPLLDLIFWAVLALALFFRSRHTWLRAAAIAVAAFAPILWSKTDVYAARFQKSRSPYMSLLADEVKPLQLKFKVPLKPVGEKAADPKGGLHARQGHTPEGTVGYSRVSLPMLHVPHRGICQLNFHGLRVDAPEGEISGYLTLVRRYTVPAVSGWGTSSNYPLTGGKVKGNQSLTFEIHRPPSLLHPHPLHGERAIWRSTVFEPRSSQSPTRLNRKSRRFTARRTKTHEYPIRAVHRFRNLPEGIYRVRFNLTGSTFAALLRAQTPNRSTQRSLPCRPPPVPWYRARIRPGGCRSPSPIRRPPSCALFWTRPRTFTCCFQYDGKSELDLEEIVLYRETYDHR